MFTSKITNSTFVTALAISALLSTSSCNKDDDKPGGGGNPSNQKKLAKVALNEQNYSTFTYVDNKISQIKMHVFIGQPVTSEVNFVYENGKLKHTIDEEGAKSVVTYDGKFPKKIEEFDEAGNKEAYETFDTYTGERLTQSTSFIKDGDGFIQDIRVNYTYYDNGNIKQIKRYAFDLDGNQFVLLQRIEYLEYDNKINPLAFMQNVNYTVNQNLKTNNPKLTKYYDGEDQLQFTVEMIYVYDNEGYPKEIVTRETTVGEIPYEQKQTITYQ